MNRNVLNTWDVDRFLFDVSGQLESPAIQDWLRRVARRWILKEFPAAGRVLRIRRRIDDKTGWIDLHWLPGADRQGRAARQSALPGWLAAALPQGVLWLDLEGPSGRDLAEDLRAVAAYFASLESSGQAGRLERIALPYAIAAAKAYCREHSRNAVAAPDKTLMSFADGFRLVLLTTARELTEEGQRMRHCVGDYTGHVGRGIDVVSLRDRADRPHVTIQINDGRCVRQIKGKANSIVARRYRRYVADFVCDLELVVTEDPEYTGLPYRPFDRRARHGWLAQRDLALLIQSDIAGRQVQSEELTAFYQDLEHHLEGLPEETFQSVVTLFHGPGDQAIWAATEREFNVGGERFVTLDLRFPWALHAIARRSRGPRGRRLRQRLEAGIADRILRFCREDDRALITLRGGQDLLGIDLRRLRHEHQERLRRRLARARRDMRRRAASAAEPYATLDRWESDRQAFGRLLEEDARAYL